jgi:hypothetical protein
MKKIVAAVLAAMMIVSLGDCAKAEEKADTQENLQMQEGTSRHTGCRLEPSGNG